MNISLRVNIIKHFSLLRRWKFYKNILQYSYEQSYDWGTLALNDNLKYYYLFHANAPLGKNERKKFVNKK